MSAAFRADLLSDTLTRPTDGMRAAMAAAEVGDDVFGEDPTVNALEAEVADLLGHEAGAVHAVGVDGQPARPAAARKPGEELVCDSLAHVVRAELGAAAVFSGISSRTWVAPRGLLSAADPLALMITGAGAYQVNTALVVVENTHNFGGGTVQPIDEIRLLRKGAQERGVHMHLDGARLWNAHVASGLALADYGREFDTVSVCLSKGLGAPVGSVLVGSSAAMAEARIWRKRYGGGMRQVGILAAAGRYALGTTWSGWPTTTRGRAGRRRRSPRRCRGVGPGPGRDQHPRDGRVRGRVDGRRSGGRGPRPGGTDLRRGAGSGPAGLAPRRLRRGDGRGDRRGVGTAAVRPVGHSCVKLVRPDSTRI